MPRTLFATQNEVLEWSCASTRTYADPFNEVELDVVITHETGQSWRVPGYWAGGQEWRVRFAPPLPGNYQAALEFSDGQDQAQEPESIEAAPYAGQNPLLVHGRLQGVTGAHHLQYTDGTPFFWLGDTWWMALCSRLGWPDEFQQLAAGRAAQGFNVVQIVAGLYPDMPGFDPRGANEAGFPWEADYARINPAYFDMADLRIRWLVRSALTPCIVACWGYYLPLLGIEKMKKHWRNLVARWGAYPVVWCLAGEANMPFYLSEDRHNEYLALREGWTELAAYVSAIDPYQRLITIHPTDIGRDQILDESYLGLNMLQTGHDGYRSVPNTVTKIREQFQRSPAMAVIVAEANYEGIIHGTDAANQRHTFWSSVLSGGCGFTYGANGLWQLNRTGKPYGNSPWGGSWGGPAWQDAARLPGGAHLALAKQLIERYDWHRFEPHPEWVSASGSPENVDLPFAAGIPGEVRLIYLFWPTFQPAKHHIKSFEAGVNYRAFFWDPRSGVEYDLGEITLDDEGRWPVPIQPELKDWMIVFERVKAV